MRETWHPLPCQQCWFLLLSVLIKEELMKVGWAQAADFARVLREELESEPEG